MLNSRLLVTGGNGFVGRAVVDAFRRRGWSDIVAPRRVDCDLRDERAVQHLFEDVRPAVVVHLAAVVGGIGANAARPGEFFHDNLVMGVHTMEQARRSGVSKFVSIGTICSYPRDTPVPFSEEMLWAGYPEETNAPYGLAKKMLLVQGQAYRRQWGFRAIHLLPVNIYGPGDNIDPATSHVIPALLRKCHEAVASGAESVTAWGDGTATREFLFVDDAAEAIVLATERYDDAEPVNLGSGTEISITELSGLIAAQTGFTGNWTWDSTLTNGQPRRCVDTSRAAQRFGFRAKVGIRDGLARTDAWYRSLRLHG